MQANQQEGVGIAQALRGATSGGPRPKFVYKIPPTLDNPFKTVSLVELRTSEHLLASRLISADATPEEQLDNIVRACVYELDGVRVNKVSAEFEVLWEKVHPKVRNLLKRAVNKLHVPEEKEDTDFFASLQIVVDG